MCCFSTNRCRGRLTDSSIAHRFFTKSSPRFLPHYSWNLVNGFVIYLHSANRGDTGDVLLHVNSNSLCFAPSSRKSSIASTCCYVHCERHYINAIYNTVLLHLALCRKHSQNALKHTCLRLTDSRQCSTCLDTSAPSLSWYIHVQETTKSLYIIIYIHFSS